MIVHSAHKPALSAEVALLQTFANQARWRSSAPG